jgi:hypothetical protein
VDQSMHGVCHDAFAMVAGCKPNYG